MPNRTLIQSFKKDLLRLLGILSIMDLERTKLYNAAISFLGTDASPADTAPDEYGCADSLSKVIQKAFPEMRFPNLLNTRDIEMYFLTSLSFEETKEPMYGDIIISVTGSGNGRIPSGHCGVVGKYLGPSGTLWVMSNDSRTGHWEANYTIDGWNRYFRDKGGMQTHFFHRI